MDLLPWGLLVALVGVYLAAVAALLIAGRRTGARALAGFVPDCAVLVSRLACSESATRAERLALLALAAYLLSPIDLVPDVLPLVGQLDDAVAIVLVLRWLLARHGAEAIRGAWPGPEASLRTVLRAAGA